MLARSPAMLALLLIPTMTAAVTVEPWRFAVETGGTLTLRRGPGDPPFAGPLRCVFSRVAQFSPVLPQPGFRQGGVRVYANATVLDDGAATCAVPPVVTAGNTTVCVARDENDCFGTSPKKFASPFGYAFVDHYAAFAPAFDRRPYVREASGALLVSGFSNGMATFQGQLNDRAIDALIGMMQNLDEFNPDGSFKDEDRIKQAEERIRENKEKAAEAAAAAETVNIASSG